MKPIFTIHAGEYLVGEELERRYKDCEVWVPAKDTGTDLLITNSKLRSLNVSLQVKFSKDFLPSMRPNLHTQLLACGWWTLDLEKIEKSNAEFWIMAPYSFLERKVYFVVISSKDLLAKLKLKNNNGKKCNVYLWVSKDGRCFETRGMGKEIEQEISIGDYSKVPKDRDFTDYLNNWTPIDGRLSINTLIS